MPTMPWSEWEDFQAGMYEPTIDDDRVALSIGLLRDGERFREAAREMMREWPNAAIHNGAHMWTGRNAWVGQATCCYSHGATGAETRQAWGTLSNGEQSRANRVATAAREEWERGRQDAQALPGL